MTEATLDRIDRNTGLLSASDGRCWDIYGDNWAEIVADGKSLAAFEGLTIAVFNSELPE